MGLEGIQDIFDTVKKVGNVFKQAKEKETKNNNDFLKVQSTQSLLEYLQSKYKDEEIKKSLGCTPTDYINKIRNDSIENKVTNVVEAINTITGQTKPELHELQNTIKKVQQNENISLIKNVASMIGDEEKDPIKNMIDEFIGLSDEQSRISYLQSQSISIQSIKTKQENKPTPQEIKPSIVTAIENKKKDISSELTNKVNRVFEKYNKNNTPVPIEPKKFTEIMNKYGIPLELGLAQATIESNIGTSGGRPTKTQNIFNVGNIDNGSDKYMSTREEGVENYAKLLKNKYSNADGIVDTEYLLNNGFKNKDGNKYATDPQYINKLSTLVKEIKEIIA